MEINENFSANDLDLSLINKRVVKDVLLNAQSNYIKHFADAELHRYLENQVSEFIDTEENEDAKKQLELTKENLRQKKLSHIKMIGQTEQQILTLKKIAKQFNKFYFF